MKNDFRKNREEDDADSDVDDDDDSQEDVYDEKTKQFYRLKRNTTSSKSTKTTPSLPASSTSKRTSASSYVSAASASSAKNVESANSTSNTNPYENFLLTSLVSKLTDKHKDRLPLVNNASSSKSSNSMQYNNYINNVDDVINLNLKPSSDVIKSNEEWNYIGNSSGLTATGKSAVMLANAASSLGLDEAALIKTTKNVNSSSSSTTSTCSNESSKQANLNRRSVEEKIDSHGSSLTNSSKQDDEDLDGDIDVDEYVKDAEESSKINTTNLKQQASNSMKSENSFSQMNSYSKMVIVFFLENIESKLIIIKWEKEGRLLDVYFCIISKYVLSLFKWSKLYAQKCYTFNKIL